MSNNALLPADGAETIETAAMATATGRSPGGGPGNGFFKDADGTSSSPGRGGGGYKSALVGDGV